ncbi:MAG: hypothetical protein WCL08_01090 [Verrucomicrobiota bacterium]
MELTLPLEDLAVLLDLAKDRGVSFESMLSDALRLYIQQHKNVITLPDISAPRAAESGEEYGKGTK